MTDIRFDGQVAIVTGAGGGLGREYALALGARGAKVVVNDLGGAVDGRGSSSTTAEAVVAEIVAAGGEAMANAASVTDEAAVDELIREVMDRWGRVDILIANAGILRDRSFAKMSIDDFRAVVDVHLFGTVIPVKAVWDIMRAQKFGRIVAATSGSGLYGNFGQSNYGAAKMGIVGFMNTLKIEGAKSDIRFNAIAPVAATRMTENVASPEVLERIDPAFIAPALLYLVSRDAPSGAIVAAGASVLAEAKMYETEGHSFGTGIPSVEDVAKNWAAVCDPAGQRAYPTADGQTEKLFRRAGFATA